MQLLEKFPAALLGCGHVPSPVCLFILSTALRILPKNAPQASRLPMDSTPDCLQFQAPRHPRPGVSSLPHERPRAGPAVRAPPTRDHRPRSCPAPSPPLAAPPHSGPLICFSGCQSSSARSAPARPPCGEPFPRSVPVSRGASCAGAVGAGRPIAERSGDMARLCCDTAVR